MLPFIHALGLASTNGPAGEVWKMTQGNGLSLLAALGLASKYNVGLVLLLVALTAVSWWGYRVWHEINVDLKPASTDELLESFHQARAEGELDEEEYSRVRTRIEEAGRSAAEDRD